VRHDLALLRSAPQTERSGYEQSHDGIAFQSSHLASQSVRTHNRMQVPLYRRRRKEVLMSNASVLYLDVRDAEELAERSLEDARHIPLDELRNRIGELGPKTQKVIAFCRSGRRSGLAAVMLQGAGFTDVENGINIDAIKAKR
jgi:rhodanese-related sulfurtransferase